jgi:hypothetical protein
MVWANSVRSVALASTLRRLVLWATVPYAFTALAVRVANPLSDLRWAPLPAGVSIIAAVLAQVLGSMGRKRY